jgi:tyrosine-protein phosphatase SIW14
VLLNLPRFRELVPGRIYRSGDPRLRVHDAHLLTLGVHTLVCVRTGGPSDRTRALAARYRLRIVEHHFGARPYHDQAVREALRDALAPENHPVLVHCDGGRHRSGVVGALVRVHIGWSLEAAITEYFELAQPSPSPDDVLVITRVAGQVARRT